MSFCGLACGCRPSQALKEPGAALREVPGEKGIRGGVGTPAYMSPEQIGSGEIDATRGPPYRSGPGGRQSRWSEYF